MVGRDINRWLGRSRYSHSGVELEMLRLMYVAGMSADIYMSISSAPSLGGSPMVYLVCLQ